VHDLPDPAGRDLITMTQLLHGARHPGSLLKETDLGKADFLALTERAASLKADRSRQQELPLLAGRTIALVFEKSSTRTRCAFEVAAHEQGAHVTYLGPEGSHIGREESIADTAQVLGRMFDGIEFRGFAQDTVEQLADYAGVPVWNGLTDSWHPTQMLADVLTMQEHCARPVERISLCFTGDARSNVGRSLLVTGAMLGMDVRILAPAQLQPPRDVIDLAQRLAADSAARILITQDPAEAVSQVDFIYTDVWVSMGEQAAEWDRRIPLLRPYQVNDALMTASGRSTTKFMHCLPAVHDSTTELGARLNRDYGLDGAEVTDSVFRSERSIVFDQAENRLHTIKAVLLRGLAN
jgi:ornithine carbamoyltransferase